MSNLVKQNYLDHFLHNDKIRCNITKINPSTATKANRTSPLTEMIGHDNWGHKNSAANVYKHG